MLNDNRQSKKIEKKVKRSENIKIITKEQFNRLIDKLNNYEEFTNEEKNCFLIIDEKNNSFVAIDNRTENMWTEEFEEKEYAIRYLQGEEIDKLRDEECKYEVCIYETEEDYNKGEPFQLNVYSDLEEAKKELKETINFNNYFSGNIINQQNGIEEFSYYSNYKKDQGFFYSLTDEKVVNEANIEDIREELPACNLQDAVKHSILNIIETAYSKIIESEQFTTEDLENISQRISDSEELNDYIDNLIYTELDEFKELNKIEEEEEEIM